MADTPLAARIRRLIQETGPISVAEYMTLCLLDPVDGYYPTRDPLGVDGDFITAPEISQMFGECLGLWVLQSWDDLGQPDMFNLVELGPGRGTMMADMLRTIALKPDCLKAAHVILIEASAALQTVQARTLGLSGAAVSWADRIEDIDIAPTLIIGNEFLDCLPIRQFIRSDKYMWIERMVGLSGHDFQFEMSASPVSDTLSKTFPKTHLDPKPGDLLEICPAVAQLIDHLSYRFEQAPGRALFIDYGPESTEFGDTLQAIRAHEKVGVFTAPGQTDLTARVDFASLASMVNAADLSVTPPLPQRDFLSRLGIETRTIALLRQHPEAKAKLLRQLHRLLDPDEMGTLFKAICISTPDLPTPLGFSS